MLPSLAPLYVTGFVLVSASEYDCPVTGLYAVTTGVFPSAVAARQTFSANGQLVSGPAYTPLPQLVNPDPGANAAGAGVVAAGAAGADDAGAECVPTAGLLAAAGER